MISSMFCKLCFGPMRLRIRIPLSSAQSSNSRRLDTSMSCSASFWSYAFAHTCAAIVRTELEQPPLGHLDVVLGESGRTQIADGHRGQQVDFILDEAKHLVNDDSIVGVVVDARIRHIGFGSGKI